MAQGELRALTDFRTRLLSEILKTVYLSFIFVTTHLALIQIIYFLGTQQDNVDDRESKGRNKILIGSENGRSKLNDEKVLEARKMRVNGVGLTAIAKHFSVTKKTIYNVVHENTWKHVQPPEPPKELA